MKKKKKGRAISPSNAGGSIPVRELRSHMPQGQKTKTWNRSNIITNSIRSFKMAHIKKKESWKKSWRLCYENHLLTSGLKAKGHVCFPVGHFYMPLISQGACFHCSVIKARELNLWPTVAGIKSFRYARFLWVAFKPSIPMLKTCPFFRSIA